MFSYRFKQYKTKYKTVQTDCFDQLPHVRVITNMYIKHRLPPGKLYNVVPYGRVITLCFSNIIDNECCWVLSVLNIAYFELSQIIS